MIVLDTNVVSELFRPSPTQSVVDWFQSTGASGFRTTSITKAEVLFGIGCMPVGRRRDSLAALFDGFLELLGHETLPFADEHAPLYAEITVGRRALGRPVGELDAQIAAIARFHGFAVATRNVKDFADCGVEVVNPWEAA